VGEEGGGCLAGGRVEYGVGLAVCGQEALQLEQARVAGRCHQHRRAGPRFDQGDAAQDQRTHDPLAQLRFRDHERPQAFRCDCQCLQVTACMGVDQGWPAAQLAHLGGELAAPVFDQENVFPQAGTLADRELAGQDDQHARTLPACFEHTFAVAPCHAPAEALQALEFIAAEGREDLVPPRGQVAAFQVRVGRAFGFEFRRNEIAHGGVPCKP
jgi:hypothetical protein